MESQPREGIDYEIDLDTGSSSGQSCLVCGHSVEQDHLGRTFCPACIAQFYDRYAKQDATLNMRINSQLLEDLKDMAKRQGEPNYQRLVREILLTAIQKRIAS
jgi:predicted DNA binding CopG/RHH family protein